MNQIAIRDQNLPSAPTQSWGLQTPMGQELDQIREVCAVLSETPYYAKLGKAGILAIWLTAREMGLPPMMCLNGGMYTFSGAVSLSANLINILISRAGHKIDILRLDDKVCAIRFTHGIRGSKFDYHYNWDDAIRAGYSNKDNWKKHPRDMLFSRCLTGGARKYFAEAIMGAYAHGELDYDGTPIEPMNLQEVKLEDTIDTSQAPKPEMMSDKEAFEIERLLAKDEEYRTKILNHYKAATFSDVPSSEANIIIERIAARKTLKERESQNDKE